MRKNTTIAVAIFLALFLTFLEAAIIGIDFGTESTKISVQDFQKPLQIALTPSSQRSAFQQISFADGERLFGSEANSVSLKNPEHTITNLKQILQLNDEEILQQISGLEFQHLFDSETKTIYMTLNDEHNLFGLCETESETERESQSDTEKEQEQEQEQEQGQEQEIESLTKEECKFQLSGEEVVGMFLQHVQGIAMSYLKIEDKKKVKDCVITVPSYFGQKERRSLLDAAKIANLNVMSLMNDHSAFAMRYASNQLSKLKEHKKLNLLLLDVGAGSTVSSLIEFQAIEKASMIKGRNRTSVRIKVLSTSWNLDLSGNAIDEKILQYLIKQFDKENEGKFPIGDFQRSIQESPLSVRKLKKIVPKLKSVLSVNTQAFQYIDNLIEGVDWNIKISRKELEEIGKDLWPKISLPIVESITKAKISKEDIDSIELVGGSARIPIIQKGILNFFDNRLELKKSINFDEGATLGAGLYAASLSSQFRVPDLTILDSPMLDIILKYKMLNDNQEEIEKKLVIFSQKDYLPITKKFKFKNFDDVLKMNIFEGKNEKPLLKIKFTKLKQILSDYNYDSSSEEKPYIILSLKINQNGLIEIIDNKLIFQFAKENEDQDQDQKQEDEQEDDEDELEIENENENENEKKKNKDPKIYPFKEYKNKRYVNLRKVRKIEILGKTKLNKKQLKESKNILKHFEDMDLDFQKKITIQNELESKIYELNEKVNYEFKEELQKYSTEEEYNKIMETLKENQEFLDEVNINPTLKNSLTTDDYQSTIDQIKENTENVFERIKEKIELPNAFQEIGKKIAQSKKEFLELKKTKYYITKKKSKEFLDFLKKTKKWVDENNKKFKKLKDTEDFNLESKVIYDKIETIGKRIEGLKKKPDAKPTKWEFKDGQVITVPDNDPEKQIEYLDTKIEWKENKIKIIKNEINEHKKEITNIDDEKKKRKITKLINQKSRNADLLKEKISKLRREKTLIKRDSQKKPKIPKDDRWNGLTEDDIRKIAEQRLEEMEKDKSDSDQDSDNENNMHDEL
ncbi:hypoxia up-regulated protein [Anaeramoeba flamelloides]|uniref:Hypoxia up-regulated protein n=1 Tax=Anaeramoeba flamelloides TaxID=1746091 RepID=A0ABQ8YB53_9EUKA|nr:hypoxia up-regulated protein [Anaeramoeba flamelloides]